MILSETTEREEYVLVAQGSRRIEVFRKAIAWQAESYEAGSTFVVHGATVSVDAIYDE